MQEVINNYLINYSFDKHFIRKGDKCNSAFGLLSAAIVNNLKEESELNPYPILKLHCLGYKMDKNHTINYFGDAGDSIATFMENGTITVAGNTINEGEGMKDG
ncbi:MAG: hypothetical protein ACOCZQ_00225 [Nanoarchaeota archaeon]